MYVRAWGCMNEEWGPEALQCREMLTDKGIHKIYIGVGPEEGGRTGFGDTVDT